MSENENDPVKKPSHYLAGPYECATVARAVFGDWAWAVHCRITAWTYLWRAGKKGSSQEDVAKAARYLAWAADIDDRRSELHRSEFDQMETDLAMSRQNKETLKGEIARLKQQVLELLQGRNESFKGAARLESELEAAKRNEETLKGEIARLRQQSAELAQGRLESQAEVRRLEEIREKNAHTIAEQRKIADYRIELAVEKDETIKSLRRRVNELLKAAKKRTSK